MKAAGLFGRLSAAMFAVIVMTASVFAQDGDTAYVPFVVNANATVTATRGEGRASMTVTADEEAVLAVPLGGSNSVWNTGAARGRLNAPAVSNSRGNITLRLPAQSYQRAEISLHAVNGRRILRGKAAASEAVSAISRRNVAAGVYLLSVRGINGEAFTARLTHSGGSVNINVAFGSGSVSPDRRLAKSAEDGEDWEITVSADGYNSHTYTLNLVSGDNDRQEITLTTSGETFIDSRDQKTYRKVTIGTQTWMAENLNFDVPDNTTDVCYSNSADNCAKYGRLYNWATALEACPAGWTLPSDADWTQLTDFAGGTDIAGTKLKSSDVWVSWNNAPANTDDYGFSALPGGAGISSGSFSEATNDGYWWSATASEFNASNAMYRRMSYSNERVVRDSNSKTMYLFSVRCIAN